MRALITATSLPLAMLLAVAVAAAAAPAASPFAYEPVVEQPRSFGHFVGDVLTQRIPLDQGERRFRPNLPTADRVGLWFQRLPARIETDAAGRRWLVVDYQVINSPLVPVSVALPALTLTTDAGAPLKVGSWPINLSPLAAKPAYANIEPLPLRPDRLPAPLPTSSMQRQLIAWSVALAGVLGAWLVWALWAERRDALRLPFARALRRLRAHPRSGLPPEEDAEAWICVHHALNETAGRVIQESTVDHLIAAAPELEPMRGALQDFYRRSSDRFFARSAPLTPFPLLELCRKLRVIERRTRRGRAL